MKRFTALAICAAGLLLACQPAKDSPAAVNVDSWPDVISALTCVTKDGPIISAHRGRDKGKGFADNSLEGLKALLARGYIMAEIDVARLKDGTMIAFHDGVWDPMSTGRGPVSASTWEEAEKLLLKTKRGKITASKVPTLDQILRWADGQFYFEIDFKSSANEKAVVQTIYDAGMHNHVILISYNDSQAVRLRKIARAVTGGDMMVSESISRVSDIARLPKSTTLGWTGTKSYNRMLIEKIEDAGIASAYGMMSPKYYKGPMPKSVSILVTDYPDEAKAKTGVRKKDSERLKGCMAAG